ncbi:MAG: peptidase E [Dokdonia sp.]|nr:peptidase E [Dokdonia sp.]
MKKTFILLVFVPLLLSMAAHKYYLSVTDMEYNESSQSLQMITRLFYDDVQAVLQARYDETIVVDATEDQEPLDRYLTKYLNAKLKVAINGESQELLFVGKEYEDDYIVLYTEIEGVTSIKTLTIENTLLMDVFPEQKNMVHTEILGKKKSFLMEIDNPKGVLNFSE